MKNNIAKLDIVSRQKKIVEILDQKGACTYLELEKIFGSSHMTVRRDIDSLAKDGLVIKTLGGVQRANASPDLYETRLSSRMSHNRREKAAIAKAALKKIDMGDTIYLDGSTTCITFAKLIASELDGLTIVTNSTLVHWYLCRGKKHNSIILIGGFYDPDSCCLVGQVAEEQAKGYFVNKAFISTKGFIPNEGIYESAVATFKIKQIICEQSLQTNLLIDRTKFGKRALTKILEISQINTIITDSMISDGYLQLLKELGKEVEVSQIDQDSLIQIN